MSPYEALRFFGLDYYATAIDIKAAYRRLANDLPTDSLVDDPVSVRASEERLQRLNRAYDALQDRVGHTAPDVEPLPGVEAGANWKLIGEWWSQLSFPQVGLPRVGFAQVGRVAAVFLVMTAVGFGIVRGAADKRFTPTIVDAKTVSAPRVAPMLPVSTARVTAVEKASPARERKFSVLTGVLRPLRSPVLRGLDPEEAKAIDSACVAKTGAKANAFQACVLRTARETPHAIHLD